MSYGRLKVLIDEARDRLEADYKDEASGHSLDEDGDRLRRLAATKLSVLNDVIIRLKQAAKEN